MVTPAISNLIRENKTYRIDSSIQTGRKHGMILLDDSLFNLWRQGLVEENEIFFKARKVNELRERVENAKKGIFDEGEEGEEDRESKPGRAMPGAPWADLWYRFGTGSRVLGCNRTGVGFAFRKVGSSGVAFFDRLSVMKCSQLRNRRSISTIIDQCMRQDPLIV